ncbi:unnamed protein product [Heterobilharzia americana]|nr:unnamed protein product [Heterobilharzia americana]
MLNANTDFIPNCSAEAGDVHEYYVKEVEKYSSLRSLQEKENEEASLALAAQILSEDGLSLLADDISPEHLVNGCSVITNNSSPVSSSSNVTHINTKCKRKINKKTAKISKTLLDYAVDTDNAEINQEVKSQQILRDETFARRLQAQYSKLLSNLGEHKLPKRRK